MDVDLEQADGNGVHFAAAASAGPFERLVRNQNRSSQRHRTKFDSSATATNVPQFDTSERNRASTRLERLSLAQSMFGMSQSTRPSGTGTIRGSVWMGREQHKHRTRAMTRQGVRGSVIRRRSQGAMLGFSGQSMAEHAGRTGQRARALTQAVMMQANEQGSAVKAAHLKEAGLSMEELCHAVYEVLLEQDLPNFMEAITLDQDGGLDRIEVLWNREKIFWFVYLLASIAFNVGLLFSMNWTIFQSYMLLGVSELHPQVTNWKSAVSDLTGHAAASMEKAEARAAYWDIFTHISDPDARTLIVNVAAAVATFEVLWIFVYLMSVIRGLCVFIFGHTEYRCYMAILHLMQHTLPTLSTFSSIKLFARVHPSLIYQEYFEFLQESWCRHTCHCSAVLATVWYVVTRLLFATTALAAFAVKLLAVGLKLVNPHYGMHIRIGSVLALLIQSVGCVLFEEVLQNRVFLFVFGGSDTEYRDDELALRNVYQCRVAKQIWTTYWDTGEYFKAVVSLTTLDHYDLQRLLIEDVEIDPEEDDDEEAQAFDYQRSRTSESGFSLEQPAKLFSALRSEQKPEECEFTALRSGGGPEDTPTPDARVQSRGSSRGHKVAARGSSRELRVAPRVVIEADEAADAGPTFNKARIW